MLTLWKESYDQPRQHIKKRRHYFANKDLSSQGCGFSSGHVCMWELDYKESWALKNWCFWTVVLEKTLASPLDCKEIHPVHSKGNQSWIFIGRTDVEAETPIFWPPDVKSWLIWKDSDAGKDWRWEEMGTDKGWAGWMASPTQWTWVWVNSCLAETFGWLLALLLHLFSPTTGLGCPTWLFSSERVEVKASCLFRPQLECHQHQSHCL